jgi:hypothetical protein
MPCGSVDRSNDSQLVRRLDAAFATDVPAELGYGF